MSSSDTNCQIGNYCEDGSPCSINGNCFYDIFQQYNASNATNITTCICNFGYTSYLDDINTIHCCYQQKNQFTAFLLEAIIGFGSGHFYMRDYWIAILKLLLSVVSYSVCCASLIIICTEKKKLEEEKRKCNLLYYHILGCIIFLVLFSIVDLCLLGLGLYTDGNGQKLRSW